MPMRRHCWSKTWPDAYFLNEAFVDELERRDRG